jgi:subtilisin family serine protease
MNRFSTFGSFLLAVVWAVLAVPAEAARWEPTRPAGAASLTRAAYLLELTAPPAVQHFLLLQEQGVAAASTSTQHYLADLEQAQQALLDTLQQQEIPLLYRTQRVYNGVAVLATPEQARTLASLPGVKALHPILSKEPATTSSIPFLSIPEVWGRGAGLRGEGIRIAVIDTGIDYLHLDFGGPGVGYAENDRTVVGDVPGFPSAKIVGGYDFAGEFYNANPSSPAYSPIPTPDPDPQDCYGHGTHVAGIAAGYGVTAEGQPYTGPWDQDVDFSQLSIGPGVAPLAELYALKVFGCSGSSDLVDLALEWSVDPNGDGDFTDRVDVINLSLGSPLGLPTDTTTVAADNAAALGVVVVASAGNSGDHRFVLGSPSNGERVISVAATQYGQALSPTGTWPIDTLAPFSSRGPRAADLVAKPDLAAPGVNILSAASGSGRGSLRLSGTSMAAPHVAGALALLRQRYPDWRSSDLKALVMNTAWPLVRFDSPLTATLHAPSRTGAGRLDLSAALDAPAIAFNAERPDQVSLSFGRPAVLDQYQAIQSLRLVDKSSREQAYTPSYLAITEMAGVSVTLPASPVRLPADGTATVPVQLVATAAALGRSTLPAAGAWFDEESGYVLLWPTTAVWQATLQGADGQTLGELVARYQPVSRTLSYTLTPGSDLPPALGTLFLTASTAQPALYTQPEISLAGHYTGSFVLEAGHELLLATRSFSVTLETAESPLRTASGSLHSPSIVLHVPLHAAPFAASAMRATPSTLESDATFAATATLAGTPLAGGTAPTAVVSLASLFQLELQSPNGRPASLPAGAVDLYDSADISQIGVAIDNFASPQAALLHFGIAAHAPWTTPNLVYFNLLFDIDGDGTSDYRLFNSSQEGYTSDQMLGDTFVSAIENLHTQQLAVQLPLNRLDASRADLRPFGSRVMVLSVRLAELNLPPGQSQITWWAESYHRAFGGVAPQSLVDRTPPRTLDLARPTLTVAANYLQQPLIFDQPGTLVQAQWTPAGGAGSPALLLLHHHNAPAEQVEVVPLRVRWPVSLYLPQISR